MCAAVVAEDLGADAEPEAADETVGDDDADDQRTVRSQPCRHHGRKHCDSGHSCHSYPAGGREHASSMLLITCPVTRTDELVADRRIRSVTNHPTHIAMHVECPACGAVHTLPDRPPAGPPQAPEAAARQAQELVSA